MVLEISPTWYESKQRAKAVKVIGKCSLQRRRAWADRRTQKTLVLNSRKGGGVDLKFWSRTVEMVNSCMPPTFRRQVGAWNYSYEKKSRKSLRVHPTIIHVTTIIYIKLVTFHARTEGAVMTDKDKTHGPRHSWRERWRMRVPGILCKLSTMWSYTILIGERCGIVLERWLHLLRFRHRTLRFYLIYLSRLDSFITARKKLVTSLTLSLLEIWHGLQ